RYREKTHMSIWPWSDIVSLVHRHCKHVLAAGDGQVYELGCGAGANVPFFRSLGLKYCATDGSPTMVEELRRRFPEFSATIRVADFTREQPFQHAFDIAIDRASLTHNDTASIRTALRLVFEALKPGGVFIAADWFSTKHSEFNRGMPSDDVFTRTGYRSGQFAGLGRVHFSDESHLRDLFSSFEILSLTEKFVCNREPADGAVFAAWNIVARKPST
ncbi:MAG: class I SAM-dependent methyltransferase, partial [Bdellovibrionales bacterium]|nr:class I SAM-dependent methyltransferase [Bdellovibrionales bacterium]